MLHDRWYPEKTALRNRRLPGPVGVSPNVNRESMADSFLNSETFFLCFILPLLFFSFKKNRSIKKKNHEIPDNGGDPM